MDISLEVIPNAMYALHALSVADLEQWAPQELYEWADEHSQKLARTHALFVTFLPPTGAGMQYGAGQSLIPLPADHLATLRVGSNGALLPPTTEREMRAGDDDWEETTGPAPTRWCGDALHENYLTLYPIPLNAGSTDLVYQHTAPTLSYTPNVGPGNPAPGIASLAPQLNACVGDSLALAVIAGARSIETDAQMPEVVSFANGLLQLYDAVIEAYWGGGL